MKKLKQGIEKYAVKLILSLAALGLVAQIGSIFEYLNPIQIVYAPLGFLKLFFYGISFSGMNLINSAWPALLIILVALLVKNQK